jgi:hypothetical protein
MTLTVTGPSGVVGFAPGDEPGHVVIYASRGRVRITVTLSPEDVASLRDWLDARLRRE